MVLCRSSQRARLPIASRLDGQTAPERRCRMGLPAIRERPLAAGDRGWSSGTKGRVSGHCREPSGPLLGVAQAANCTSRWSISYCVRPMCPGEALTVANTDGNASSRGGWLAFSMLPKAAVLQAIAAMQFNHPRPGCNLLNTEAVHHTCLMDA
jgi:hypothetical protein